MPPKSKRGFNLKSLFGFGSSKPKVKGEPRREVQPEGIANGITDRLSDPRGASASSPSPPHRTDPDVLALQSNIAGPLLDFAIGVGSLDAVPSSPSPDSIPPPPYLFPQLTPPSAFPSLFANAHNFRLQNLYYHNVQTFIAPQNTV
jgi:hypothetical protein